MSSYIQFRNITKQFGVTVALNDVSFEIKKGEIHCLCGENGAGKSTLINLCAGVFLPTKGEILIDGKPVLINSVKASEKLGISVVHQEVPLCLNMSIAHNIFLGAAESMKGPFVNEKYMKQKTQELLDEFGLKLSPGQLVETLSIAEQSIIQIAKAVYFKPKILILDEPTAALTNDQRETMYRIVRKLVKENGTTVMYVSHRMEEVMELGDRTTIFRDGAFVCTDCLCDISVDDIITKMVGRDIDNSQEVDCYATQEVLLSVKGLSKKRQFQDVSFDLKKGEILGIAGFVGAGRTEVLTSIFGANTPDSGEIQIKGQKVDIRKPLDAIRHKISLIPENRRDDALIAQMSVQQNAQIVIMDKLQKGPFINAKKAKAVMEDMMKKYSIKAGNRNDSIMTLSGGNQQKVIIARWIANQPDILLCDEPTRGIDVGAKAEVYEILRSIAKEGIGIVMVSSELPELLALCDRIIVMHEGKVTGEVSRAEATEELIMRYAAKVF
ncbi:MAG: sugar ABC transporter ATP-binding protein [Lachnospiraceae bacterium]